MVGLRHRCHKRLSQTGLHGLAFGQALAQVGAQAAQGGDAGDDAGLFGEWGKRKHVPIKRLSNKVLDRGPCEVFV